MNSYRILSILLFALIFSVGALAQSVYLRGGLNNSNCAGIEFSRFQLGVTYGHGLQNLIIDAQDDEQISNRVWQFHLGFELLDK